MAPSRERPTYISRMVEEDDWREEDLKMRLKYYGGEERLGLRLDSHFNHCPSKQGRIYRSGGGDLWPAAFQSDRERVELVPALCADGAATDGARR